MNLEDKKKIYNLLLGYCYILNEKKDCYLIYAENSQLKYIVCDYIDTSGAFVGQKFFGNLEEATKYFDER